MNDITETIGEHILGAIRSGDADKARELISGVEEWVEDYVKSLSDPLSDTLFLAIYRCGLDNISWEQIRESLESYFEHDLDYLENKESEED